MTKWEYTHAFDFYTSNVTLLWPYLVFSFFFPDLPTQWLLLGYKHIMDSYYGHFKNIIFRHKQTHSYKRKIERGLIYKDGYKKRWREKEKETKGKERKKKPTFVFVLDIIGYIYKVFFIVK